MTLISRLSFVLANAALVGIAAVGFLTTFAQAQDTDNTTEVNVARSDALAIAETEADSAAVSIELESENGIMLYSIHTANGQEIEVNAADGAILRVELAHEHCDDDDENTAAFGAPTITLVEAMTTAETEGDSPAISADLEVERGVLVYNVELRNGVEIEVDAADGTVLSVDNDDLGETSGLRDEIDDDDDNESSGFLDDDCLERLTGETSGSDDDDDNETSGSRYDDDDDESSGSGD